MVLQLSCALSVTKRDSGLRDKNCCGVLIFKNTLTYATYLNTNVHFLFL